MPLAYPPPEPPRCRSALPDGTSQTPSKLCYLAVPLFAVVNGFAAHARFACAQALGDDAPTSARSRAWASAAAALLLLYASIYVLATHCGRCEGWLGLGLAAALTALGHALLNAVQPASLAPCMLQQERALGNWLRSKVPAARSPD